MGGNQKLDQLIRRSLTWVFVPAFVVSVAGTWLVQSAVINAQSSALKASNRELLRKALLAASDRSMLDQAWRASKMLPSPEHVDTKLLTVIAESVGADEIHLCDTNAVIVKTTVPEYLGMDFKEHDQTRPFCCLLSDVREFAQNFGPIAYDSRRYRKFVAVALDQGGFLQLGFNEERYLPDPDLNEGRKQPTLMMALMLLVVFLSVLELVLHFFRVRITQPIKRANAALARIASGNLNEKVDAGGSTEMDALAEDINTTVNRLKGYIDAVEHRADEELSMAKAIQTNVLPTRFPPYPDLAARLDIFARMITARQVGGDFYDFYLAGHNRLAIVVADVSGKGIPAALFMMRAKTTLQEQLRSGMDVAAAVTAANERLADSNEANMFVTAWVCKIDLETGEGEFVNAGHNPPLVKRSDGSVEFLRAKSGPPIAAMPGVNYRKQTFRLNDNDGIVLYTDGVTEAVNPENELYGEERLQATVRGLIGVRDAGAMLSGIVDSVRSFANGAEQSDDITLLGLKLKGRTAD